MRKRQYKRRKGKSISKAKKYTYNGIEYKSGLEKTMAVLLTENKIPFKYEPVKYELQSGFKPKIDYYERQSNGKGEFRNRSERKVLPITYTPDFIGEGFIIETKGYANESFPMKWKIFKKLINDENITLFKPQNKKECEITVQIIKKWTKNKVK